MPGDDLHEPAFSGTTDEAWSEPRLEDFETDDLGEVADHSLLSVSGFPPENFSDLKLPVVDPDGNANRIARQTAKIGGRGVGAIDDLDEDAADDVGELIDELANERFEDAGFGE